MERRNVATTFADELVALFVADERDKEYLEVLREDFAALGLEEAMRQCTEAEQMLQGLVTGVEDINIPLYLLLIEARQVATEARERMEAHKITEVASSK
jgi:hypothetical protein